MARSPNPRAVRAAMDGAERLSGRRTPAEGEQLNLMPVTPLGKHGTTHFYLDGERQLIELAARDHSRLGLQGLFGRHAKWLYDTAPRMNKEGSVSGWRPELIAELLMTGCSQAGIWDPEKHVRGRGAWRGDDGELVLHLGDRVLTVPPGPNGWRDHRNEAPGKLGRFVYPSDEPTPGPWPKLSTEGPDGPASQLLRILQTWNWRRPEIDAELLLGWIGAAMIGGALDWRPLMWLTGGKSTGKSTLQKVLWWLFGDAIVRVSDTSGAGIWQALKRQTLPVAVDEAEAEEDNRRFNAVVTLARQAASGGVMRRGTADHRGVEFTVRSAFLFSSILIPPLMGQDRSRMAILELADLKPGAVMPELTRTGLAAIGEQLRRRMVDGWLRFEDTLAQYRAALQKAGHTARGQDQFGTLLACADILQFDYASEDVEIEERANRLSASRLAETEDDARDEDRCLAHLLSTSVDPYRNGGRRTLAEWIAIAAGMVDGEDSRAAQKVIMTYGLRVDRLDAKWCLSIANYHRGTSEIYQGTHWAGRAGTLGVYLQAFRRLPGATRSDQAAYFGGSTSRAVTVPLDVVLPHSANHPAPLL